jgi:hypothetical protein
MVTPYQITKNAINFLKRNQTEMNYLEDNMWTIFDLFDDIYFELKFISMAIRLDELSSLLEQEPEIPISDSPLIFEHFD